MKHTFGGPPTTEREKIYWWRYSNYWDATEWNIESVLWSGCTEWNTCPLNVVAGIVVGVCALLLLLLLL
jgi:hypothetical protein